MKSKKKWAWAIVINYDCGLGDRNKIISRHSTYDLARQKMKKTAFNSFLRIANLTVNEMPAW